MRIEDEVFGSNGGLPWESLTRQRRVEVKEVIYDGRPHALARLVRRMARKGWTFKDTHKPGLLARPRAIFEREVF